MNNFALNELKIEVTHNCPLACVHCSSAASPQQQLSITTEKCLEVIYDAVSIGAKEIAFSGGEPFIWDGLLEVVKVSKQLGLYVSIYTSGNCESMPSLIEHLSIIGVDRLIFSIYSNIEKEHTRVTRKSNSYRDTLEAMKVAKQHSIHTEIHFVALASNYKKLPDIVKLAKSIGVKRVSVLRFVPQGRGLLIKDKDTMSKVQYSELKSVIIQLRREGFDIRTGSPFNVLFLNEHPKCMAAQDRLIVAPDLDIFPCDAFKQIPCDKIYTGDRYSNLDNKNLIECWQASEYFRLVRSAILGEASEPCKSCDEYSMCLSGCLAQKYLYYSSLYRNPDPACTIRSDG